MEQLQGAGRFNRRAIRVKEAQQRILGSLAAGRAESVPLRQACGRRLAETLHASCNWPPFARSGLDGYAVCSSDTIEATPDAPAVLKIVGQIAAGEVAQERIVPGTAMRIMTGAAVPSGADAVIMLEQTSEAIRGNGLVVVQVKRDAAPGQNVTPAGMEYREGNVLAAAGVRLRPGHVALLGTFGYEQVPVYATPRAAIISTGSELLPIGAPLTPGRIRDSNSAMLAAMVEETGGEAILYERLSDDPDEVNRAIAMAMEEADVVLTTGGVSVGDYDVMAAIMHSIRDQSDAHSEADEERDNGLLFDKVAMRPGSPTSAAMMNGKLLLALSGNPGACFVGFELFARPALKRLQGAAVEETLPAQVTARLTSAFDKGSPHERFVRTRLYVQEGQLYADPLAFNKSSMMASLPEADGLIRIPAGPGGAAAGDLVEVIVLNQS